MRQKLLEKIMSIIQAIYIHGKTTGNFPSLRLLRDETYIDFTYTVVTKF